MVCDDCKKKRGRPLNKHAVLDTLYEIRMKLKEIERMVEAAE
jgi:hypothetical protein